nr:MAG TPA: hypothetical protein [Caudoviricetes sp.]
MEHRIVKSNPTKWIFGIVLCFWLVFPHCLLCISVKV